MKRNVFTVVALLVLLFGSECFASGPAVIGGIRDGVALGLMGESGLTNGAALRYGFEANTSNTPGIIFVGGKWFLSNLRGGSPMFISGGLIGCFGNNNTAAGPYISMIFERLFDVAPLFLECGIDVVKSGSLQFQVGYYF
jgi:hypothetical protein